MKAQDIIIRPVITEKSMTGVANKKYTFEVCQDANKIEIAKAVEELFGVKVAKVNTVNVQRQVQPPGQQRRLHPSLEKGDRNPHRGHQDH